MRNLIMFLPLIFIGFVLIGFFMLTLIYLNSNEDFCISEGYDGVTRITLQDDKVLCYKFAREPLFTTDESGRVYTWVSKK